MVKKLLICLGILIGILLMLVVGLIVFLSVTEYKPAYREQVQAYTQGDAAPTADVGKTFTIYTWNLGYAGLGEESDFFMDGGQMVDPPSQEIVEKNMAGIQAFLEAQNADAWLLQEIDINSARTDYVNQFELLRSSVTGSSAFACNYKCPFVPIPVPPIGANGSRHCHTDLSADVR